MHRSREWLYERIRWDKRQNPAELVEADAARLSSVIVRYSKVDLLCLDDFGYLNLDKKGAKLLLQFFTAREERKATTVASNALFSERDKTFTQPRPCVPIADRLTVEGTLIQTGADSCRLKAAERGYRSRRRS
ncbi:ATP-binding protein [Streptomyces sp. NPDC056352]|uniref:ATP-binding protein n=1 Tax=Streptomyces sp. NPDC056352 TaxID=3345791 RepID=UPI0035E32C81